MAKRTKTSTCQESQKSNYYLYYYLAADNGEIVYIGKATGNRVNELNKHFEHNPMLKDIYSTRGLKSRIEAQNLTLDAVKQLEEEHIRLHKPICNQVFNGK